MIGSPDGGGDLARIGGARKAAALVVALGVERGSQVLRGLAEPELEEVTREVIRLQRLPAAARDALLQETYEQVLAQQETTTGGPAFARELLARVLGSTRAEAVTARADAVAQERPFSFLADQDPAVVAGILEGEHPQTIALVLTHAPKELAAPVLAALDPEIRIDVTARIAQSARTPPELVHQVETLLRKRVAALPAHGGRPVGGVDRLVELLGTLDTHSERAVLSGLELHNPELAVEVRKHLFVFDDVKLLDDQALRKLLPQVHAQLPLALRNADDDLKKRVFGNMSARQRQDLQERIAYGQPVPLREIEEAQQQIVDTARRLAEQGDLVIPRGQQDTLI